MTAWMNFGSSPQRAELLLPPKPERLRGKAAARARNKRAKAARRRNR